MDFLKLKVNCKYLDSCYIAKSVKCSLYKYSFSVQYFLLSLENPEVIYAQVGGTVTLLRDKVEGNADNVYVNWYRGSDTTPTISRNPQSQSGEKHVFEFMHFHSTVIIRLSCLM